MRRWRVAFVILGAVATWPLLARQAGSEWVTGTCALVAELIPAVYKALNFDVSLGVILITYIAAFCIGTATHLDGLLHWRWFPHHPLLNIYWTSLAVLDPLAAFLLIRAPKAGLLLALVVILTDVGINSAGSYLYLDAGGRYAVDYFVQLQSAFLGFLLGSAPFVWTPASGQVAT